MSRLGPYFFRESCVLRGKKKGSSQEQEDRREVWTRRHCEQDNRLKCGVGLEMPRTKVGRKRWSRLLPDVFSSTYVRNSHDSPSIGRDESRRCLTLDGKVEGRTSSVGSVRPLLRLPGQNGRSPGSNRGIHVEETLHDSPRPLFRRSSCHPGPDGAL